MKSFPHKMKSFVIDGSKHDFHSEINKNLCPKFKRYGKNYNAFVDILRGGFGEFQEDESVEITVINSVKLNKIYQKILKESIIEQGHIINFI